MLDNPVPPLVYAAIAFSILSVVVTSTTLAGLGLGLWLAAGFVWLTTKI